MFTVCMYIHKDTHGSLERINVLIYVLVVSLAKVHTATLTFLLTVNMKITGTSNSPRYYYEHHRYHHHDN
jgi:hypothetical protein